MRLLHRIKRKIFYKLWIGIIAVLLLGFALSGLLYYRQLNYNMETRSHEYIFSSYQQIENGLTSIIDQYDLIARNTYTSAKVNDFLNLYTGAIDYTLFINANDIISDFENMHNNSVAINNMLIIPLNAKLASDGVRLIRNSNYLEEQQYQKVLDAAGNNVWLYFQNKKSGAHQVAMMKYLNYGRPGGILIIELDESILRNLFSFDEASKNSVYILDERGTVISSNHRHTIGNLLTEELSDFIHHKQEKIEKKTMSGSQKYVLSGNLHGVFDILVLYDVDHLIHDNRVAIFVQLILLTTILVATIFFVIIFGAIFAKRIRAIVDKMKRIQEGNRAITVTVHSHDELEYMDRSLYEMAHNITELNAQIIDAAYRKNELELKFLQMQIKPHFLYNSLSSLRWLSMQQYDSEVSVLLEHLIQFYKISLSKGKDIIPIQKEIELVESYVALENLIHKDQILLDVYLSESVVNMTICKMALQPFVENSIHHGKPTDEPLNIWVSIEEMNDMVEILIEDDGLGMDPDIIDALNHYEFSDRYSNFGVFNTMSRLKMFYGNAELIVSSKDRGTVIDIIIPYTDLM